jgi:hypothetical protein
MKSDLVDGLCGSIAVGAVSFGSGPNRSFDVLAACVKEVDIAIKLEDNTCVVVEWCRFEFRLCHWFDTASPLQLQ